MNKFQKSALIGVGALVLSTVAIQASDLLRGVEGNLAGLVSESTPICGRGAVQILLGSHTICVDEYEASPSDACPQADPQSPLDTQNNINTADCIPVSEPEAIPWRFISLTQAQQLCARAGKRLPSNEEWYKVASGIANDDQCAINAGSSVQRTGSGQCLTPSGVHDMVGNVWEWVDEEVKSGIYAERTLPESGYVALVDSNGVVIETAAVGADEFGNDYAWTDHEGVRGMIRGGFYGSGEDAGIFAQNMSVALDSRTAGIGFRCVKDL